MTVSLRDQLLGLGFSAPAKPEKAAPKPAERRGERAPPRAAGKPSANKPGSERRPHTARPAKPAGSGVHHKRSSEEMDLAKAYAIRAQREKEERIEAERQKQEAARIKREAKAKVGELLAGKSLNAEGAEIARHFEYGGKIRRIYVTPEQLRTLNAGDLAVVQLDGRYLLVALETAAEVESLLPSLIALRVDPNAVAAVDPYADPSYQIPDDLIW